MGLSNHVRLSGLCAEKPQLKQTKTGRPMSALAIYTREYLSTHYIVDEVHRCLFFGEKAVKLCDKAEKGRNIEIEGVLRTKRVGEGKEAKYYTNVVVQRYKLSPRQSVGAIRDCLRDMVNEENIKTPEDLNGLSIFEGHESC
jgi:single-stranded DNA-binding protein